ncbi:MAG: DUF2442 domain-containing protein [Chloroflexota bacterium]|nr:DUF2442 domain-containing protein [Chloroflexota bacterium]
MSEIIHVTDVEPLEAHRIRATFSDGAIKEIDLSDLLAAGGVFTPVYERREVFEQVRVNPESQTVEWPGDVDPRSRGALRASRARVRRSEGRSPARRRPCRPPLDGAVRVPESRRAQRAVWIGDDVEAILAVILVSLLTPTVTVLDAAIDGDRGGLEHALGREIVDGWDVGRSVRR